MNLLVLFLIVVGTVLALIGLAGAAFIVFAALTCDWEDDINRS